MPTDQVWWAGPQPPSPGQLCRGLGHSPKPAGGCWRGFGELSLGSGWPWPRPPTTPGCGARWDHRHGTRSSCGCPPVVIQDRAHRRHEESGCQEPQSLDARIHGPPRGPGSGCKNSWPSQEARPWLRAGLGLGALWPQIAQYLLPSHAPNSSGPQLNPYLL